MSDDDLKPGMRIVIDREHHATVRAIRTPAEFAALLTAESAKRFRDKARERRVTAVATVTFDIMLTNLGWSNLHGAKLIIDVIEEPPC